MFRCISAFILTVPMSVCLLRVRPSAFPPARGVRACARLVAEELEKEAYLLTHHEGTAKDTAGAKQVHESAAAEQHGRVERSWLAAVPADQRQVSFLATVRNVHDSVF